MIDQHKNFVKNSKKRIFRWECHHDAYSGKDRECCNCKGNWSSLKTAIANGKIHNQSHRWCGWGYPSLDWENRTVNVFRKTPTGKRKIVIPYDKLNEA